MSNALVTIDKRFCGPASSGNGGYTCGLLADFVSGDAEITLRSPPPLEKALTVRTADDSAGLFDGETLIAEARHTSLALTLPETVSLDDARIASRSYVGFRAHPYPSCFVCGPSRPHGDGLALYPGAVEGRDVVAAVWAPGRDLCDDQQRVRARFMWAALDCPSWFGYGAFHEPAPPVLLGRLSGHVERCPNADEPCVVMGWSTGRDGRKIHCCSAILSATGQPLAWGQATWIVLKE